MPLYKLVDERDVNFVLFDQLKIGDMAEIGRYSEFDEETYRMVVNEAIKFAEGVMAPLNPIGDRVGCKYENGKVTTPDEYKPAWSKLAEGGWIAVMNNPEFGGMGMPGPIALFVSDLFHAACSSFSVFGSLPRGAGHLIESFGTEELRQKYVRKMYTGLWGGTMCLTEPHAGSDVGAAKTGAKKAGDHYLIQGTKQFITCGEHDVNENIIHLVLARTEGAPEGAKGLSLFAVPKILVNEDGSPGEPNDVQCSGIEHKMGLHGSPTCVMNFGDNGNCKGWLVGEECRGIMNMFQMMNEERLRCGAQGLGNSGAAYLAALDYARERIQGKSLKGGKGSPSVPIINHPDVRRMLIKMKAYVEASRAILYKGALYDDLSHNHPDKEVRSRYLDLLEVLTPVAKAYCSDKGFEVTTLAVQVLGGYGYCKEYPVEQLLRDCKISSIYEGTNGIQAMDLLGRKLRIRDGAAWNALMNYLGEFTDTNRSHPQLHAEVSELDKAKQRIDQTLAALKDRQKDVEAYFLNATLFLEMVGHTVAARELLEQALVAIEKKKGAPADGPEADFLDGKVTTARFFTHNILPEVNSIAEIIMRGDESALKMPDSGF